MKKPHIQSETIQMSDYPIFIGGYRNSGTTLLVNLLDSHPELLVWPDESTFFYEYFPIMELEEYSSEEKLNVATERVIGRINLWGRNIKKKLDIEELKKEFRCAIKDQDITPKNVLLANMKAFQRWYQPGNYPRFWVLKTAVCQAYTTEILEWFPNAKFIIVLREPKDVWASLSNHWPREKKFFDSKKDLLQNMIENFRDAFEFSSCAYELYGAEKIMFVHYEDIVANPVEVMKNLAEFIGIKYADSMIKPTVLGMDWYGNNRQGINFDGISSYNTNRWKERIDKEEAKIVEHYMSRYMIKFGYPFVFSRKERFEAGKEHYKWFMYYHKSTSKGEIGFFRDFYKLFTE